MKTNLQFFADPSNDPEPTDPKPTSNDPAQDPKDSKPSGKTYTQDDIGKMMAAKAKEVESNLKDDFEKELKQKEQEWLEKGEKRAGKPGNLILNELCLSNLKVNPNVLAISFKMLLAIDLLETPAK